MWGIFFLFLLSGALLAGPIDPIPESGAFDAKKAQLGKILFFDPRLSKDSKVSCAHCHQARYGGSNGRRFGRGVFGKKTKYNVPSIYNLRFQYVYGWTQKRYSIKDKIEDVIQNPNILDSSFKDIVNYLRQSSFYRKAFKNCYKKIDKTSIVDALYNYLLTLTTPDSKFDRYLRGETALNKEEKEGYELFKRYGCIACHNGKAMGGHIYFRYGYFLKQKEELFVKCPSLRNVALTAPYFHDGSVATLEDAVRLMAKAQLGKELSDEESRKIATFLKTLTGRIDE